ncbi:FkbM family methyltransferase [soil metagenome]
MTLMRRVKKLATEPAFRAEPARVLARAGMLAASVALGRSPAFTLTRAGRERMRAPADFRYTSITAFLLRDWTEPELRALDRLVKPGDVVVDVGANIGLYALKAARLVGADGRVVALEPGAEAYAHLSANLAMNAFPWARAVKLAASDNDGEAVLHHVPLGRDPQAFSLIANARAVEGETVATLTLDTLATREGLDRIDLIKIDVEGAEPLVIAGATRVLAHQRPAVLFECNAYINAGGSGAAAGEAWTLLAAANYRFFRLIGDRFEPIASPPAAFCNVLAVHAERQPPFDQAA